MNGSKGNLGLKTSETRCLDEPLDKGLGAWRGDDEAEAKGDEEEAIGVERMAGGLEPTLSGRRRI